MASMTAEILAMSELDPSDINDLILEDERWKLAEEYGLKSVDVQVNPIDPSHGRIRTKWADPAGVQEFMLKFIRPFHFSDGEKSLIEPKESPLITVSAHRLGGAVNLKKTKK